jgi:4-amino-4-deoxy-L-arabinose transferase-like glycosyltransferase
VDPAVPPAPAVPSRRDAWLLGSVVAVALLLRVAYVLGQRHDVLFDFPVVDEERYVAMGRALGEGRVPDPRPWFHPPGLVYALGLVFRLAGPGLLVPRLVQALVSAGSCALTYRVGRRFVGTRAALGAAALCAVHGVLVFESYELLPPTWMLAADLVALWLLVRAKDSGKPRDALGAGVALGVAGLFGPTILPFGLVAAAWLRRPVLVACLVLGAAVPIAQITWGNWQRGHEVVLISTNGGINFYLGNGDDYEARLAVRPGPHWDALRDAPRHAGAAGESGASKYYFDRGLSFWQHEPVAAMGLYLRKLYLYFDGPEIPRDTDLQVLRRDSWLLSALTTRGPPWLPDGLLVPLALVGAVAHARRPGVPLLLAFVGVQALVVAAFFVTSRYRVPALPVFAMLASAGIEHCVATWRDARGMRRLAPVAACVALAIPLNVRTRESAGRYDAELDFYRGLALRNYEGNAAGAAALFEQAEREDPTDARYPFELGNTRQSMGQPDAAVAAWSRAADDDPWDARSARKASTLLGGRGDLVPAIALLEKLVAAHARPDAYYGPDYLSLAVLQARRGDAASAIDALHAAQRADPAGFHGNIGGFSRWLLTQEGPFDPAFLAAVADADASAGEQATADLLRRRASRP